MVITYKDALKRYGNKYKLLKAVENKEIYKIEKGYYSETKYYSRIDFIMKKYPRSIFTSQSAFFYLGFSDYIPDKYYISTKHDSKKIPLKDVKQTFESADFYGLGKIIIELDGVSVNIYNRERMLVELMRNHTTYSFDYYKEIIIGYREKVEELDMDKLMDYLDVFSNSDFILEKLNREVF